jgi:class 3 adenylate cyclase/tetratricopeptide (TPR) repeat protein
MRMKDPQAAEDWAGSTLDALRPRLKTFLPTGLAVRLDRAIAIGTGSSEFADVLLEVAHTLESLRQNLGTYLPRSLVLSHPTPGVPRGEMLAGTVLFVDINGFTPLAERLRALGEEGAERLNRMINNLFSALLDPLSRSHGDLLIFAGDAVQAYFPAMDNAQDAGWATRAGLRMARAIAPFEHSSMPLSVSIGLARGRFFAAQIGTAERMEYLVTGGPIQKAIKAEENAGPRQVCLAPGMETLLASQFRLRPISDGHHVVVDDLGDELDDFDTSAPLLVEQRPHKRDVLDRDTATLTERAITALSAIEKMAPFFPPNVLRRIVAHQRERQFPGEHRLVGVMFVNLRGFEELVETLGPEELPQLTQWINHYFVEAQETLAGCGGLVTHVDPHEEGFTLLCPFGAPLADEDTPHRATAAALRLNEKLRLLNQNLQIDLRESIATSGASLKGDHAYDLNEIETLQLTHHIGITYGPIYTGQVGWQERREYVVVGDDVNLSARLMSESQPGQILISGWVHDRVRQSFECHPLEPMKLKGKAKPVTVYAVDRRVPASAWLREAAVGPLVGRDEELSALEHALDALEKGHGGGIILVGETGMGKTRLIAELALRSRYWNISLLAGRCLSYAQGNPYTPWIEALWRWFELDAAADDIKRRSRVYEMLEQLGLAQLAETFWSLLGLPTAETLPVSRPTLLRPQQQLGLYSILEERVSQAPREHQDLLLTVAWRLAERDPALAADIPSMWEQLGQRVHPDQALVNLLEGIAEQGKPLLFLIEDLQWADRASWTPLINLTQATSHRAILLVITARPGKIAKRWLAETGSTRIVLNGLGWSDTGKLAARLIMAREATPELVSWLHERARGNPLFTSQLLYALAGAEGLSIDKDTGRVALSKTLPSLPLTVREIMLSRVDQLPEETRTVVKLASVVGDTVPWEILTHLSGKTAVSTGARLLEHIKALADQSLLTPEPPAPEFAFVHPLLKEAVYTSVPYAQRRKWHRIIADYLAQGDAETLHRRLEALAYHYRHSDAPKLGARYNRWAGDHARVRQAWDEAKGYYQAAIDIAVRDPSLMKEQSLNNERLGDVYALTGKYEEAASAYESALVESSEAARLEARSGLIFPLLDRADQATQLMKRAWDELDKDEPLRPWLAAALGWLALRGEPKDMTAVAGSGAAAITWWQRGQRTARSETVRVALKEMMAGRVPSDYGRLVQLALDNSEESEGH